MYVISLLILCLSLGQSTDIDYYLKNYQESDDDLDLEIESEARTQLSSTMESIVSESTWKAPSVALSLSNITTELETQSEAYSLVTSTLETKSTMGSIVDESNWKAPSVALQESDDGMDLEIESEARPQLRTTMESIVDESNWKASSVSLSLSNTMVHHPNHSNIGNG